MMILAVDSSGTFASVAVLRDGEVLHEIVSNHGLTHSQTLMPMVDDALCSSGVSPQDIDLFACVAGPGSFTGVRIGVCAVKGMAHATGKPCIGLNALETLAAEGFSADGLICPMLDARRDQVYAGAYRYEDGTAPIEVIGGAALSVDAFFEMLPGGERLIFTGDGATAHESEIATRFGKRARILPANSRYLRAATAGYLAYVKSQEAVAAKALVPIYFRAPQAERERLERGVR